MRKIIAVILVCCMLAFTVSASAEGISTLFDALNGMLNMLTEETETPEEPEEPAQPEESAGQEWSPRTPYRGSELAFAAEHVIYDRTGDTYLSGYYSAEIYNGSDSAVTFVSYKSRANVTMEDGTEVESDKYISTIFPETILPGESAVVNISFMYKIGDKVPDKNVNLNFEVNIMTQDRADTPKPRITVSDVGIGSVESWDEARPTVHALFTNETGETVRGLRYGYAVFGADGSLIYADGGYLDDAYVLRNGASIEMDRELYSWVRRFCEESGEKAASAMVICEPYN